MRADEAIENLAHRQGQVSPILGQYGEDLRLRRGLGSRVPGQTSGARRRFLDINPLGAVRAAGDEFFEMLGFKSNLAMMNPNVRYPSRVAQFAQGTGFYSEVRCSIFEG